MSNVIILGSQWGDEGKGKIVDLFSERFDIVARYQGGHNAGHTVFIGDEVRPQADSERDSAAGKQAVIGNGLVIDPAALLAEIDDIGSRPAWTYRATCTSATARTFYFRRTA